MFSGAEIVAALGVLKITDVVWLPDSEIGRWDAALSSAANLRLHRVCREGEAWPLAAGLHIGGRHPLVMLQTTGLFESGDAMRNALFDLKIPLPAIVGHRSYLLPDSPDTAKTFAEPILKAWGIDYALLATPSDKPLLVSHLQRCAAAGKPGFVLLAEGRM
jgi:sulfopyruvate decarboxylase TPP-binding subunit